MFIIMKHFCGQFVVELTSQVEIILVTGFPIMAIALSDL